MTAAGRIDAIVDGRPLTIEGDGHRIRITIPSLITALSLRRRGAAPLIRIADALTKRTGFEIVAKAPYVPEIRVSPERGLIARALTDRD